MQGSLGGVLPSSAAGPLHRQNPISTLQPLSGTPSWASSWGQTWFIGAAPRPHPPRGPVPGTRCSAAPVTGGWSGCEGDGGVSGGG